ncbi:MAG TPA: hypothetical protein VF798_06490 [Burkholderiaceae bacterium]
MTHVKARRHRPEYFEYREDDGMRRIVKTGFAMLLAGLAVAGVAWLAADASVFAWMAGLSVTAVSLAGALLLLPETQRDDGAETCPNPRRQERQKNEFGDSRPSGIWRRTGGIKREGPDSK